MLPQLGAGGCCPSPRNDKLASAIAETLKSPGARDKLSKAGAEMFLKGPDEYAAYVRQDAKRMLPLIEAAGLRENQ